MGKFIIVVGVVFAVLITGIIIYSIHDNIEYKAECEARGGVVLKGRDLRACVDPKALK